MLNTTLEGRGVDSATSMFALTKVSEDKQSGTLYLDCSPTVPGKQARLVVNHQLSNATQKHLFSFGIDLPKESGPADRITINLTVIGPSRCPKDELIDALMKFLSLCLGNASIAAISEMTSWDPSNLVSHGLDGAY